MTTIVFLSKFIITKYLKQEVDHDLGICMDERRYKDNWRFIKIHQCHAIKR